MVGWWRGAFTSGPVQAAVAVAVASTSLVGALAGWRAMGEEPQPDGVMDLRPEQLEGLDLPPAAYDAQGVLDRDLDGIADALENILYGTDPANATSGGLNVPDGWLLRFGYQPGDPLLSAAAAAIPPAAQLPTAYGNAWPSRFILSLADVYGYGRPATWNESAQGPFDSKLDPREWDNNDDGIPDGWLIAYGLDPLSTPASQRRAGPTGLTVGEAFKHGTDPQRLDTDADGLDDAVEVTGAPAAPGERWPPSDPRRADSGGGGVCDGYLAAHGLDPSRPTSSYSDPDHDGATTLQEYQWSLAVLGDSVCKAGAGLDPRKPMSGSSKIPDGWLIRHGQSPLAAGIDAKPTQRASTDPRAANVQAPATDVALTVWDEYALGRPTDWQEASQGPWMGGTDPSKTDSDGDGLGDAWEQAGVPLTVWPQPGNPMPSSGMATSDPTAADSDGDGASDAQEAVAKTDPRRPDTDFDGITDSAETQLALGLDARRADTAGDLLRDGERLQTLRVRAQSYAVDDDYEYEGPGARAARDWISLSAGAARLAGSGPASALSDSALLGLLAPGADLDDDGEANVLDDDMDGDRIINGAELHPELYTRTSFDLPDGLAPATDPLNPETDGDLLPDGWELDHVRRTGSGFTLDPSSWDTNADGTDDGAEDPDADGIVWVSFTPQRTPNTYVYNNVREHRYGTDPNARFTDGDGLVDGWKAFWGIDYASVPPAELGDRFPSVAGQFQVPVEGRPTVGTAQPRTAPASQVLGAQYERYSLNGPVADEVEAGPTIPVSTSQGTLTFHRLQGFVDVRFQDVQAWGTNPYLADTDGDAMPDWWEVRSAEVPSGVDLALAQCIGGPAPQPLQPDGTDDPEGDGVGNAREYLTGGHPLCADTDMAGVRDGHEADRLLRPGDPTDDASLRDATLDTDADGLRDFTELTETGTGYDDPDTDGDGLLDGPTRQATGALASLWLDLGIASQGAGDDREFLGEADPLITTDPTDVDDYGVGVPAGWVAMRLASPLEAADARPYYELGRPAWWQESAHGPWWGGADPGTEVLGDLRHRLDLDGDGLDERDGSGAAADDLQPANPSNVPRQLTAPAELPGLQTRLSAQGRVAPAPYLTSGYRVPHPVYQETADTRTPACLHDVRVAGVAPTAQEPLVVEKGANLLLTGRVQSCASQAALVGVAVQAFLGGESFGAGITQPGGAFAFDVLLDGSSRSAVVPSGSLTALRGVAAGPATWDPDAAAIPVGATLLDVRTAAGLTVLSATAGLHLDIEAEPTLTLVVPTSARTGEDIVGRLVLVDGAGVPLRHPVHLHWDGQDLDPVVPRATDGGADFTLPAVDARRGGRLELFARTSPPAGEPVDPVEGTAEIDVRRPGAVDLSDPASGDAGSPLAVRGQVRAVLSPGRQEAVPGAVVEAELRSGSGVLASAASVTDARGRFHFSLDLPLDLARGSYQVVVKATATSLAPSEAATSVQVRAQPRFMQVEATPIEVGQAVTATGLLLEPQGTPVAGVDVTASFEGRTSQGRTDTQGRFTIGLGDAHEPGAILQTLTSQATDAHLGAIHRSERLATTPTTLAVVDGAVARGSDASVKIQLRQADGAGVPGAAVLMAWGTEPARVVITAPDGVGWFLRSGAADDALGDVTVSASYAGLAGQGPSTATSSWSVQALAAIELPGGENLTAGSPALLGRLVDAGTHEPLAHRPVTVDGPAITRLRNTDEGGFFVLLDQVAADAAPSRHDLTVRFAGDAGYPAVEAKAGIAIRSAVEMTCRGPAKFVVAQPGIQVCEITDARGLPVDNGTVSVLRAGQPLVSSPVRVGAARLDVAFPNGTAGAAELRFEFSGTPTHAPANVTLATTVLRPAWIQATADPGRVGRLTTLRFEVRDDAGPLAGHVLTVFIAGNAGIQATTDDAGMASIDVRQDADELTFLVRSAGQEGLAPTATAGLVEAKPFVSPPARDSPWLALAAASAVLAVGAAVFLALRARATPLDRALRAAHRVLKARGPVERRILEAYRELEDGAIGLELLQAPARTARTLEERLSDALGGRASDALDRLITLFEHARYGDTQLPSSAPADALRSLAVLQRELHQVSPAGVE